MLLVEVLVFPPWAGLIGAASHREAPLIAMDPAADITDVFFFRSYEPGKHDKVILMMDVFPGGEPSSGPNYFYFDPTVRYSFHVDNDRDGRADDVRIDVRFRSEFRGVNDQLGLFLPTSRCLQSRRWMGPACARSTRSPSPATATARRSTATGRTSP